MEYGIKSVKYSDTTKDWKFTVGQQLNNDRVEVSSIKYTVNENGEYVVNIYTSNKNHEVMLWKTLVNVRGLELTHNTEEIL